MKKLNIKSLVQQMREEGVIFVNPEYRDQTAIDRELKLFFEKEKIKKQMKYEFKFKPKTDISSKKYQK